MATRVALEIPDETLARYRQGAAMAQMPLETFIVERLINTPLLLPDDFPPPLDEELRGLDRLDDESLWKVAQAQLSEADQERYELLLDKQQTSSLTAEEQQALEALGQQARLLTLKRAHAYMLLKWRGHSVPPLETLEVG